MSYNRAYNFSAGPSMLPLSVIESVAENLPNYKGCGESVMEMSHRSKEFKTILEEAEKDLREIMNIPDNYKVMFLQGGGTLQFAMVPLNLLRKSGKADYIHSQIFSGVGNHSADGAQSDNAQRFSLQLGSGKLAFSFFNGFSDAFGSG